MVGYWKRRWRMIFRFSGSEKEYFIPSFSRVTVASWVTMSTTLESPQHGSWSYFCQCPVCEATLDNQ